MSEKSLSSSGAQTTSAWGLTLAPLVSHLSAIWKPPDIDSEPIFYGRYNESYSETPCEDSQRSVHVYNASTEFMVGLGCIAPF